MAITTTANRDFNVQVLVDTVQGVFAQKTAFMGSRLVSAGACTVNPTLKEGNPKFIGQEVTVPYFGTLGEFVNNPDGSSSSPVTLSTTNEKATVSRDSLSFETSVWAQNSGPEDGDPYEESARQILVAAERAQDTRIIAAAAGTPLIHDVYSASSPVGLTYNVFADAAAKWGDENENIVAAICHSRAVTDLRKLTDGQGRPLLVESQRFGDVPMFMGVPIVQSDRAPITGSVMGTVASSGTTPPVLTITGTPLGAFNLWIKCTLLGAHATAKIQFSTDGGQTYSADLVTAGVATPLSLIDTATDSLVGVNGKTGLSVAFAAGTFAIDNLWKSTTNLKASTMLVKRGALAFWYNRAAIGLKTDQNILADTDIAAMHLYAAAHRYRRVLGGSKPGVVLIRHNVSSYAG